MVFAVMLTIPDVVAGNQEKSKGTSAVTKTTSSNDFKQAKEEAMKIIKEAETAEKSENEKRKADTKPAAEKVRTPLSPLALAEKEVADANSIHISLVHKVAKLKKSVVILQGQYEILEENAKGLEQQVESAKDTKDRAEGQYRTTKRRPGIGKRLSERERDEATRRYNGLIAKAADARAAVDRKKIVWDFLKEALYEAEKELAKAETTLQIKQEILKATKKR